MQTDIPSCESSTVRRCAFKKIKVFYLSDEVDSSVDAAGGHHGETDVWHELLALCAEGC